MASKVASLFRKNTKKRLSRPNKNYYYFCKSNIPVINLIVGSRNMICKKLDKRQGRFYQIPTISLFLVFEKGRIFESAVDK